jgi:hypothetical protein
MKQDLGLAAAAIVWWSSVVVVAVIVAKAVQVAALWAVGISEWWSKRQLIRHYASSTWRDR